MMFCGNFQASGVECPSPVVCIKDSLYPLRKELLNKPYLTPPWSESEKNKAKKPFIRAMARTAPNTRARSKETVINSPWIKSETSSTPCSNSVTDAKTLTGKEEEATCSGETGEGTGNDQEGAAGQSFARTRAQKRKLSFKENREMEVSLFLMTSSLHVPTIFACEGR